MYFTFDVHLIIVLWATGFQKFSYSFLGMYMYLIYSKHQSNLTSFNSLLATVNLFINELRLIRVASLTPASLVRAVF